MDTPKRIRPRKNKTLPTQQLIRGPNLCGMRCGTAHKTRLKAHLSSTKPVGHTESANTVDAAVKMSSKRVVRSAQVFSSGHNSAYTPSFSRRRRSADQPKMTPEVSKLSIVASATSTRRWRRGTDVVGLYGSSSSEPSIAWRR